MFCPQCGFKNDDQSRHCAQCGTALNPAAQAATPPPAQPQAPAPWQQPQQAPPPPQAQPPWQQPPQGAPTYYPPPPNVPGVPMTAASIPNYMTQAILVTLFCCIPLGIVGIVKANSINKKIAAGDFAGALADSKSNKTLLWIGFGVGIAVTAIYLIATLGNLNR
jgi:hypothetical protein